MPGLSKQPVQRLAAPSVMALLIAVGGCYDGSALIDRARNDALKTRIEAVDLGWYEITMPRSNGPQGMTEVQVEPFGRIARYKLATTEQQIEDNEYLLRHAVVLTVRSSDTEDFADPNLTDLRSRLLTAIHDALGDRSIESIGFHQIRFIRH